MGKLVKGRVEFTEENSQGVFGYLKGTCKWAELLTVGQFGTFSIKMYGDSVIELEEELKAMQDSAYDEVIELGKKATKAELFKAEEDGTQYLGFKLKETKFDGTLNKVTMYDAGGTLVEDWDKLVGNGSTVKIKYRAAPYYMASTKMVGISYSFYAVQVIKLVEYAQGDSGFGDESGDTIDTAEIEEDF